jgi:REP element-mobilizing transposase RayT
MLLVFPPVLSLSNIMQQVKAKSWEWIHETFPDLRNFQWQEGYGAFSIGVSQKESTIKYIVSQKEHHRTKSFREEYIAFLQKNRIKHDERYI